MSEPAPHRAYAVRAMDARGRVVARPRLARATLAQGVALLRAVALRPRVVAAVLHVVRADGRLGAVVAGVAGTRAIGAAA